MEFPAGRLSEAGSAELALLFSLWYSTRLDLYFSSGIGEARNMDGKLDQPRHGSPGPASQFMSASQARTSNVNLSSVSDTVL